MDKWRETSTSFTAFVSDKALATYGDVRCVFIYCGHAIQYSVDQTTQKQMSETNVIEITSAFLSASRRAAFCPSLDFNIHIYI
jgi:hypothetical protein